MRDTRDPLPDCFVTRAMENLASCFGLDGRPGEELKLRQELLTRHLKESGPEALQPLWAMTHLADFHRKAGPDHFPLP